jgi:hypothetical protein
LITVNERRYRRVLMALIGLAAVEAMVLIVDLGVGR